MREFGEMIKASGVKRILYRVDLSKSGFSGCSIDLNGDGKCDGPAETINHLRDVVGAVSYTHLTLPTN